MGTGNRCGLTYFFSEADRFHDFLKHLCTSQSNPYVSYPGRVRLLNHSISQIVSKKKLFRYIKEAKRGGKTKKDAAKAFSLRIILCIIYD